ncbi:hypothetical protein [Salinirubrum litoreum]|uniref:Uncharacterized protein n=1 Tax=Salinirubrum litoreum TaxID=1126234 RepID=A0ABD5R720_9EURY|nr:hypothetical protein [Salinirubrum litoreum]
MTDDRDDPDTEAESDADGSVDDAVPLTDWRRVESALRDLDGTVTATDDRIELRSGSARFAVTRDGRVEAGMPLHDLTTGRVTALAVDHDRGAIRLVTDDGEMAYEFRLP